MGVFRFRQFDIDHSESAMKVGTDGVLLGAWVDIAPDTRNILDVGTGSGLIALMMAQRTSSADITAIEIDEKAAAEASGNIGRSPWTERITALCDDFIMMDTAIRYDLIVSNPPFFTENLHSPDSRRALARHGDTLNPTSFLTKASSLVAPGGSIALIAPTSLDDEISFTASLCRLNLMRCSHVCTREGKLPSRTLWQWTPAHATPQCDLINLRDTSNNYTTRYLNLVNDFYLWLK